MMSVMSRVQFKVGAVEFSAEGEGAWVSAEVDKLLLQLPQLPQIVDAATSVAEPSATIGKAEPSPLESSEWSSMPLPVFLKTYNALKAQTDRFLATAAWLQLRGKNRLLTGDVTKALSESNQSRLSNPSDCLGQSINKGYCERTGKEFFVTPLGFNKLFGK